MSFRDAVLRGQPEDRGLYFPEKIPQLSKEFLSAFENRPNEQIAFHVIKPYVGGSIPDNILQTICAETVSFSFPLIKISDRVSALELFHGPTLAFKDVGARFMSRCLQYFSRGDNKKTIVIVATSGDTGGAVAAGFHGVENVEVVILYPKNRVSMVQELQLTTLGGNITAVEVQGAFDDCQRLAKQAIADTDLQRKRHLTSANSINVARWLPQQFYYFFALKQWSGPPPVISVPSGNFGNLAAGVLANLSGLPVKNFIAACNANDTVPAFFETGEYKPKPSVATLSNAMDVGSPSNFVRILEMLGREPADLREKLKAVCVSDQTTAATVRDVFRDHGYVLDPHGAVGYRALADYLESHKNDSGIFLETAHPIKFDSVANILGSAATERPKTVEDLYSRKKSIVEIEVCYDDLRDIISSKI
jgi:threonine synthase